MKYFHGQDQSNCSSKEVNDRFVAEAAPLSPSRTERYSELHTTEPPIEFHEEETRIGYAVPSLDQQENKGEISMREDTCETMQSADDQVISCSLSKQEHDAFIQETSALSSSGIWHILWTLMKRRELRQKMQGVNILQGVFEIGWVLGLTSMANSISLSTNPLGNSSGNTSGNSRTTDIR